MTPSHTPPVHRKSARDDGLCVKGTKCTYDPELDKSLSRKDKRDTKASFEEFGTKPEDNVVPSDPRLAIPNYRNSVIGKAKAKYRPTLYGFKTWDSDAVTTVTAGPPAVKIVVTGFDPAAPLAHISAFGSNYGEVSDVDNKTDPITGRFLGICTITYQDCASFRGSGPIQATLAAKTAALDSKRGPRLGLRTVKIELDRDGSITRTHVQKAIAAQRKETGIIHAKPPAPQPAPASPVTVGPPPSAPRGPAARSAAPARPPPGSIAATFSAAAPKPERPARSERTSLVESNIIDSLKNQPYIFISSQHVPVLSTTIPHMKKRLRTHDWREVRCDHSGYYLSSIIQERMELRLGGNPAHAATAEPPPPMPAPVPYMTNRQHYKQRRIQEMDLEEEKKQRAKDLDPARAVLQLVVQELRDKLIEDVKSRIAAKALYEYLEPARLAEKRRRYGIDDPEGSRRGLLSRDDGSSTPDSRFGTRRRVDMKAMNALSLPRIAKRGRQDPGAAFRDERRSRRPQPNVRSLFHQLSQFHDEEEDSDDERATSITRDTEEPESRPPSRMSMTSISDDDDALIRQATKRRMHAKESSEVNESVKQETETAREDMVISKLERSIYEMSPSSRKRKRLMQELQARKRQKADDELFGIDKADLEREDSIDVKVDEIETPVEATPEVEEKPIITKPKPKPKKKTKKQIQEEQEAERRAQAEAEADQIVDNVLELAEEEEALAEEAERRPVVEWGVSANQPEPTVEDDEDIIMDLRGWQASIMDDEDLQLLNEVLHSKTPKAIGDVTAWAWRQEQIRNLKPGQIPGALRKEPAIEGYYVSNPTGSARTEPLKKILESEKSKYLPHRIKVQKAREKRQAEAKKDPSSVVPKQAELPKTSSRGKRADDRRTIKDLATQRELLETVGGDDQVLTRFNQLQKRKKPVKFARSAIHNWGLYSLESITAGEMIIEYVGEKIRQEVADLREIKYTESGIGSSYLFRIDEGTVVDATKKGGIARFINHSCDPNCTAKIIRVGGTKRIVIYALRDIEKDEELTYDYKFEREIGSDDRIPCLCGSANCKGFLN
ncbi:Histone-lysine N-methyltransferase, H3 lysine-4 specific [Cyphellophora attinorum]|uniref:Histone-lysine N-methyltransferase, H3 lysine-4 specific n=1 Tax=Cyphellophora attinorum TaxID=1664694 RepID=A0A0N1HHG4_9EURO|nr:Histone-lysine N-methyltransferase, H3 lysine-4 specific [Phialophora attinorum]KPI45433.1 Histone-lysine N-methyltransferase, H3 lysine-4 specific [Phialophora attinorum]